MDEETRKSLLSSVDAAGNPKWKPATVDDLPEDLREQVHGMGLASVDEAIRAARNVVGATAQAVGSLEVDVSSSTAAQPGAVGARGIEGAPPSAMAKSIRWPAILTAAALFSLISLAAIARLYVLFFVTEPQNPGLGWYGDVFHHWQIAYLSQEIGFSEGFLRLWDFKGLEFFWGLLHPLVLVGLFSISGSVDIIIPRLLSVFASTASYLILFYLLKRYFNLHVAFAGVLLAAFNPVALFNDTVGMQEPLGLLLLFGGFLLIRRRPALTGILWAMAGMVRAEYWVFGIALVVIAILSRKYSKESIPLAVGWVVPSLLYMKYLANYTGNPIYPIYWNYLAGTAGRWIEDVPMNPEQLQAQLGARIALLIALFFAFWLIRKRHESFLFLLLGVGNIIMIGIVLGLGEYVKGYVTRVLFDRLLEVPYMFVGIFLAIGLLYILPRVGFRWATLASGWAVVFLVLAASQIVWLPILETYVPGNQVWEQEAELADQVASHYDGGTILIPEDRQALTYALVRNQGIEATSLAGQMYDPFAYMEGDPFADWEQNREVVLDWLSDQDIRLMVFYDGKSTYDGLIQREPDLFEYRATVHYGTLDIYSVELSDVSG